LFEIVDRKLGIETERPSNRVISSVTKTGIAEAGLNLTQAQIESQNASTAAEPDIAPETVPQIHETAKPDKPMPVD